MSSPAKSQPVVLPKWRARSPLGAQAGFTLIELLVAVAVTALLAGVLIIAARQTFDLWQASQDRSAQNVQAQAALSFLVRDLEAAFYARDDTPAIALDILPVASLAAHNWRTSEPLLKPDIVDLHSADLLTSPAQAMQRSRFGRAGAWLRFISFLPSPAGTLRHALSYQVVRRPISGAVNASAPPSIRYTLFRHFATADATFSNGYDITTYDAQLARAALDQALCDNVVDFGLCFYRRESSGMLTPLYPRSAGERSFRAAGQALPDVADIMLRVLSESGAARLEQMELGRITRPPQYASDEAWWWALVEAESRLYTTRVILSGPRGQ